MIYLYGYLRVLYGESINCKVNSVTELMKALEALRPGFKNHIQKDRKYIIKRGSEFRKGEFVDEDEINMRFNDTIWHIVPLPIGHSAVLKIVVGIVLVVAAIYMPAAWGVIPGIVGGMGAGLVLGGVAQLLTPVPEMGKIGDDSDNQTSFLFNGPKNRMAAGGAVPLVYGFNVHTGSIYLSGGLEVGDVNI